MSADEIPLLILGPWFTSQGCKVMVSEVFKGSSEIWEQQEFNLSPVPKPHKLPSDAGNGNVPQREGWRASGTNLFIPNLFILLCTSLPGV